MRGSLAGFRRQLAKGFLVGAREVAQMPKAVGNCGGLYRCVAGQKVATDGRQSLQAQVTMQADAVDQLRCGLQGPYRSAETAGHDLAVQRLGRHGLDQPIQLRDDFAISFDGSDHFAHEAELRFP